MDVNALKASWDSVSRLGDAAAEIFYAVLFTMAPQLQSMFPPSMTVQREKLLKALGDIVCRVEDPVALAEYAGQLGRDHRRFGVIAQHYPIVGQALLETLRRGLGPAWTPALAADWSAAYQAAATIMVQAAEEAAHTTPSWWAAEVLGVSRRAMEITVLTIRTDQPYPFAAGQSFAMESSLRPRIWRYFSPANAMRPDGTIEIHVRAVPGGSLSPALVYNSKRGDLLRLGPAVGTGLTKYRASGKDLLLIAGGTGLAPLRAIVEDLAQQRTNRKVTLIVGTSIPTEQYDLEYLGRMHHALPWLTVIPTVSRPSNWTGEYGRAVEVALRQSDWMDCDVYVCGSPTMVAGSRERLFDAGLPAHRLFFEDFSNVIYRGPVGDTIAEVRPA